MYAKDLRMFILDLDMLILKILLNQIILFLLPTFMLLDIVCTFLAISSIEIKNKNPLSLMTILNPYIGLQLMKNWDLKGNIEVEFQLK